MGAFLRGSEYLALPREPHNWIIKNIIPTGGSINIYGEPKAGKSFVALGMAHAISSGQSDWLGFPILKHGPVMYLQADMPRGIWADDYLVEMQKTGYDIDGIHFADLQLFPQKPFNIMLPESFKWLQAQVQLIKPVLVFLDVLRELFRGDENDSDVMSNVMGQFRVATAGSAFGLISHAKKAGKEDSFDNLMGDNRGSSYTAGAVDVVMKVTKKHLIYAGRSKSKGNLDVLRMDNGLHTLDPEDQHRKHMLHLAVQDALALLPAGKRLNVSAVARDYAQRACGDTYKDEACPGLSSVNAGRHVKAYLEEKNLTRHLAK